MAIDFPNSPTLNQTYTVGQVTWKWDGSSWKSTSLEEIQYLQGVTSDIQTQINSKQNDVITAQGDLVIGNSSSQPSKLAIGTSGQVLTSNGTTASWTAPASGGMTLIASGSLSTEAQTSLTNIPQGYKDLKLYLHNLRWQGTGSLFLKVNNFSNYGTTYVKDNSTSLTSEFNSNIVVYPQTMNLSDSFVWGSALITIAGYSNLSSLKSAPFVEFRFIGGGGGKRTVGNAAELTGSLLSPVTSIQIIPTQDVTFLAGNYELFGVK